MGTQATDIPTREEHEARAMLLGRWYDHTDGTYCNETPDGQLTVGMLDCITLEPVFPLDARARRDAYYDKPKPWEREE